MAESIALPILTEVAKPMVKIVATRVTDEIGCFVNYRTELNELQEKIQIIAGIVDRMTAVPNEVVPWLRKTIRIIHKAEDMLDVLAYEKHRRAVMKTRRPQNKSFSAKIRLVFLPLRRAYVRTKMASWIRRIKSEIEALMKEARFINELNALARSASLQPAAARNTVSDDQLLQQLRRNVNTSLFVGRDSDVASVVDMLGCNNPAAQWRIQLFGSASAAQNSDDNVSCTKHLPVVAIVGFGGIGKTTLTKKVYEDKMVLSYFRERIWISELKDFEIEKILTKMVEFLMMGKCDDASSATTIGKLKGRLGGKRYLLVLDDVWSKDQLTWTTMRDALEKIGGSKGSVILVTTRDDAVAKTMHATIHPLSGLSKDDSWSLFKQIAFANEEASAFEDIGKEIVNKCKGVPLAIRSIAGILHNVRNHDVWKIIAQSEIWDDSQQNSWVLPSLKLSYNFLPPMLKKCFTICAFTPKNRAFSKSGLIARWIALGLIQKSNNENKTMEDIGEEYVNELLSISFLLVYKRNELEEATSYILHDLVYDLARSVAMHERLYFEASRKVSKAFDIQHLNVDEFAEDFPDAKVLENIRSLEVTIALPERSLVHMKYLRVLSLQHSSVEVVPESIGKLKCLKYLNLSTNPIKVLPVCVMELYNLQRMNLLNCKLLLNLPRGLSNLVNLRHLGLSFHFCPQEEGVIGQLSQLQTLPPLQVSLGGFQISELRCLHHVKGILDIKGLEFIKSKLDAENSELSKKPKVEQLRLSWDNDDNYIHHEAVLDGLHPHPNLKLLSIKGYGGEKFPAWLMKMNVPEEHNNAGTLCNLIKIKLIDCKRCQQLPTMGHLPLLKLIEIRNMVKLKQIDPELYGVAELLLGNSNQASSSGSVKSMVSFASLKELRLSGLVNLEEWCEPAGPGTWTVFPFLEILVIEGCRNLKEAPNKFPSLKELIVEYMSSSNPVRKILRNKSSVSNLTKLEVVNVEELTHIPEEVGGCTSLQTLVIWWCPKLERIPNLSGLGSLRELHLLGNYGLRGAPEGLESCKSLETLSIGCCGKVETLPDLSGLSRLRDLNIGGMSNMIRQPPDWLFNLPSLRVLHIGTYYYDDEFPDMSTLLKITSLERLNVYGWEELQNLPEQLQQFTALKSLGIADFNKVEDLPDWLGNLSSLQNLYPTRCERLKKLPSKEALERLPNFSYLQIEDCPLLEQAIDRDNGAEYHKIAARNIQVGIYNSTP